MTIQVSWRNAVYYVGCAFQVFAFAFHAVFLWRAFRRGDYQSALWAISAATFALAILYAMTWARAFGELHEQIGQEARRGHTAQATVHETMLRHINEATGVEINIAAPDDGDAIKH